MLESRQQVFDLLPQWRDGVGIAVVVGLGGAEQGAALVGHHEHRTAISAGFNVVHAALEFPFDDVASGTSIEIC